VALGASDRYGGEARSDHIQGDQPAPSVAAVSQLSPERKKSERRNHLRYEEEPNS
jgi:hypothetical protein